MSWFGEDAAKQAPIFSRLREYLSGRVDGNGPCGGNYYCRIRLGQWQREQNPSPHQLRLAKSIFDEYVDRVASGRKKSYRHRSRQHRSRQHRSRKHHKGKKSKRRSTKF